MGTNIKSTLAELLKKALESDGRPEAQIAAELEITRQRLYQLKTADKVASSEAIASVLEQLGYRIEIAAHLTKNF